MITKLNIHCTVQHLILDKTDLSFCQITSHFPMHLFLQLFNKTVIWFILFKLSKENTFLIILFHCSWDVLQTYIMFMCNGPIQSWSIKYLHLSVFSSLNYNIENIKSDINNEGFQVVNKLIPISSLTFCSYLNIWQF